MEMFENDLVLDVRDTGYGEDCFYDGIFNRPLISEVRKCVE